MIPCYDAAMTGENDNLFNFIATTVETLSQRVEVISEQMATKVDIANLRDENVTKADLAALRDELRGEMATMRSEMATKSEVAAIRSEMATMRTEMASKNDLERLETTMHGEFEQVHIRFNSLDRRVDTRMGQIETDVSRLRSVVYLLVKDKPDMLRLLGQPTSGDNPC